MQTPERDFAIKISGLEIYNENVKDLLNAESGRNLKLLDDPEVCIVFVKPFQYLESSPEFWENFSPTSTEIFVILRLQKGTVVEKLVEETANDDQHLRQLINICEGK